MSTKGIKSGKDEQAAADTLAPLFVGPKSDYRASFRRSFTKAMAK